MNTMTTNPERLLMSTARIVHRESCPSMGGYRDGFRVSEEQSYTLEDHPQDPDYVRQVFEVGERATFAVVTLADLSTATSMYRRCKVCSPDAPEGPSPRRATTKAAGTLAMSDIGRASSDGVIVAIRHESGQTIVQFEGGSVSFDPADRVEFPILTPRNGAP